MRKLLIVITAALALCITARADSIENLQTTESVSVSVGCWNPSVCGDPAAYWSAWDLPVPVIEPPSADFSASGVVLHNWNTDSAMQCEYWPSTPVATPEPSVLALLVAGLLLAVVKKVDAKA
jgi:hypothetical protein